MQKGEVKSKKDCRGVECTKIKNEKEDFIRCGKRVGWPEFDLVSEEGKMF